MVEDRNQIHYRIDTLLKYYGIKDEEKLLKYLKAQGQKVQSQAPVKS
jgi:arginine repressor